MNPVGSTTQNCGENLRAEYEEVAGAKHKITDTTANKKTVYFEKCFVLPIVLLLIDYDPGWLN